MTAIMTISKRISLVQEDCCACDITYAVPEAFKNKRLQDGQLFYCPSGHAQSYTESENKTLRRQVEQLQAKLTHERDQRLAAEAEAARTAQEAQRTRTRVANGVCPCCKRSFANVARHMKGQHPNYAVKP